MTTIFLFILFSQAGEYEGSKVLTATSFEECASLAPTLGKKYANTLRAEDHQQLEGYCVDPVDGTAKRQFWIKNGEVTTGAKELILKGSDVLSIQ